MLVLNPYPQTPFPGKGAILLGLPPLDQARMLAVSRTKPLHDAVAQMADDLYGGYAPKQGCFGCLPKVLHDAKPTEQAISDTHFYIIKRFIDSLKDVTLSVTSLSYIRLFGVFTCRRKCDGTFDTLFLKLAGQLVGLLYIALIDKAVCVTAA